MPGSFDKFPYAEYADTTSPDNPILVDIGGAGGHQCVAFRNKYPDIPGRVILQDLEPVVQQAKGALPPGIEAMVHDFFLPQPVNRARAYYMRTILHDWPDHLVMKILQNIKSAMDERSIIIIDETVVKELHAHPRQVMFGVTMGSCIAGLERTAQQWVAVVEAAGLKIRKVYNYAVETGESLIIVGLS